MCVLTRDSQDSRCVPAFPSYSACSWRIAGGVHWKWHPDDTILRLPIAQYLPQPRGWVHAARLLTSILFMAPHPLSSRLLSLCPSSRCQGHGALVLVFEISEYLKTFLCRIVAAASPSSSSKLVAFATCKSQLKCQLLRSVFVSHPPWSSCPPPAIDPSAALVRFCLCCHHLCVGGSTLTVGRTPRDTLPGRQQVCVKEGAKHRHREVLLHSYHCSESPAGSFICGGRWQWLKFPLPHQQKWIHSIYFIRIFWVINEIMPTQHGTCELTHGKKWEVGRSFIGARRLRERLVLKIINYDIWSEPEISRHSGIF